MHNFYSAILVWVMRFSYALPILIYTFLHYDGANSKTAKGIVIYSFFVCFLETYFEIAPDLYEYGIIGLQIYMVLFPTITLLIYWSIFDRPVEKRVVALTITAFLAFACIQIWLDGLFTVSPQRSVIGLLLIIFTSIYFLFKLFRELKVKSLVLYLPFWFSASFLFHASATFFLSLFQEVILLSNQPEYYLLWQIQYYTAIIFNLFISMGLWKTRVRSFL